jgi:hypothetical protein
MISPVKMVPDAFFLAGFVRSKVNAFTHGVPPITILENWIKSVNKSGEMGYPMVRQHYE